MSLERYITTLYSFYRELIDKDTMVSLGEMKICLVATGTFKKVKGKQATVKTLNAFLGECYQIVTAMDDMLAQCKTFVKQAKSA